MGATSGGRDALTVRQSVHPAQVRVPIEVQVATPGTAETVITLGDGNDLEVVRAFALVVDMDCYIKLGGDPASPADSTDIPLEAGDSFDDDNCVIAPRVGTATSAIISIINKYPGERPTIRGVIAGY